MMDDKELVQEDVAAERAYYERQARDEALAEIAETLRDCHRALCGEYVQGLPSRVRFAVRLLDYLK